VASPLTKVNSTPFERITSCTVMRAQLPNAAGRFNSLRNWIAVDARLGRR
jgi:hypothetical protein